MTLEDRNNNLKETTKYLNVWDYKPWWCQPWSIILTGISIIVTSWLLTKIVWIAIGISIPIILWWVYFLIFYPQLFKQLNS
jgi:hypothetical protein